MGKEMSFTETIKISAFIMNYDKILHPLRCSYTNSMMKINRVAKHWLQPTKVPAKKIIMYVNVDQQESYKFTERPISWNCICHFTIMPGRKRRKEYQRNMELQKPADPRTAWLNQKPSSPRSSWSWSYNWDYSKPHSGTRMKIQQVGVIVAKDRSTRRRLSWRIKSMKQLWTSWTSWRNQDASPTTRNHGDLQCSRHQQDSPISNLPALPLSQGRQKANLCYKEKDKNNPTSKEFCDQQPERRSGFHMVPKDLHQMMLRKQTRRIWRSLPTWTRTKRTRTDDRTAQTQTSTASLPWTSGI